MNVEFRAALPEDADAAAPLIYSSGPRAFDFVFAHQTQTDAQGFLRQAFVHPYGEFGYHHHIVGVLDGEVIAAGTGFTGHDALAFTMGGARGIFSCYGVVNGARVCKRGLQLEQMLKLPKKHEEYIAHIGVASEMRSMGIGEKLVNTLLDRGRERGSAFASLDVSVENPRAEALYERMGFRVTRECVTALANATATVPNHRRMELPL